MPSPSTIADFLAVVRKSQQIDPAGLEKVLRHYSPEQPASPRGLAEELIRAGVLTSFQAEQFLQGKHKGFQLGVYRILDRLGRGGSGLVYLAEQQGIGKRVAIKLLPPACAEDPLVLERFRREARAAGSLDHPNIVRVHDLRREGAMHYMVMEYVEGPTLHQLLNLRKRLAVGTACEYARQTALGLHHAHLSGLIHRDIKPANLIVDPSGTVKILDLGLARYKSSVEGESLTQQFNSNQILGTADYLAPEQALNLEDIDGRVDIYGLGATLYALLTGQPPFPGGSIGKKLMMHQTTEPTAVHVLRPEVPEELSRLVATMLAKKPADRPQTGEQTAAALQRWADLPSRTALQPSAQTLTDLRIDPATGVLFTSKGALASPGRIAASTVMVEEDDTLALDPRQKQRLVASRPAPTRRVPRLAPVERRKPKGSPLVLTMIGLAIGLGLGLAVGLAGVLLAGR